MPFWRETNAYLQNIKANGTSDRGHIWMPDFGHKSDFRGVEWVCFRNFYF